MELITKVCAAGILTAIVTLVIKRTNSEIAVALSACCVIVILMCVLRCADILREMGSLVNGMTGYSQEYVSPILKCLGIAIATKFSSELCKDASQGAISTCVEFAGIVCAVCVSMPLLMSVLKMLGGLI